MNSSQRFIVVVVVNSKLHISCSCWNQWEFYYWHHEKQDLTLIEKRRGKEKKMRKKEKNEPESSKMTSNSDAWLETLQKRSLKSRKYQQPETRAPFHFGFPSKFSFEFSACELWNWGITNTSHCWKCRFSNFPFSWKCFCLSNGTEKFSYWVLDEAYKNQQRSYFREASTNFLPYLCLSHDMDHYQSLNLALAKSASANRQN